MGAARIFSQPIPWRTRCTVSVTEVFMETNEKEGKVEQTIKKLTEYPNDGSSDNKTASSHLPYQNALKSDAPISR